MRLAGYVRPDLPFIERAPRDAVLSGVLTITRFPWRGQEGFAMITRREYKENRDRGKVTSSYTLWQVIATIDPRARDDLPSGIVASMKGIPVFKGRTAAWVQASCMLYVIDRVSKVRPPMFPLRPAVMNDYDEHALKIAVMGEPKCPIKLFFKITLEQARQVLGVKWDDNLGSLLQAYNYKLGIYNPTVGPEDQALVRNDSYKMVYVAFARSMVQRWRHRRPIPTEWEARIEDLDKIFRSKSPGREKKLPSQ